MIKEKHIYILIRNNIDYYRNKGYICSYNDEIEVRVEDLSKSCKKKITAVCGCGTENTISYTKYISNVERGGYYGCRKCSRIKAKQTSIEKYGSENFMKTKAGKDKLESSNLKKYGVKTTLLEKNTKLKIEETNIQKYGFKHALSNKNIRDKAWKAFEEKYGSKTYSQSNIVKNKTLEEYKSKPELSQYKLQEYNGLNIKMTHKKCGETNDIPLYLISNRIYQGIDVCTSCNPLNTKISSNENEIKDFLDTLNIEYTSSNRKILDGKELDIYIPEHKLAIEFNGLYWHSEAFKEKNYHSDKTEKCQEKGIHLIHVYEDDWNFKRDIVKSIIKNQLRINENIIYARMCDIRTVSSKITRIFLDNNHIQGFSKSKIKLGLYYDNELVSIMTFGSRNINKKKEFELIRFCNKLNTSVVGSSSKLFKYFIKNYLSEIKTDTITSYADSGIFNGSMYDKLGFNKVDKSSVSYYWVVNGIKEPRFKYNKKALVKDGFDNKLTEVEIMHGRGYYRIWTSKQYKYIHNINV